MASSKFIKTKSNYVIRDKHQVVTDGTVFERDFMTISGSDGVSPDEEQYYRSSNFKFVVRSGINRQRKHTNGSWITPTNESLCGKTISDDSRIILNPDYESMKDFAYYGSAVDMVKSTVINAVINFPAELYFTNEKLDIGDGGTWYQISNDFGIDLYTKNPDDNVENKLRYLANMQPGDYRSFSDYTIEDYCTCTIDIHPMNFNCDDVNIYPGALIAKSDLTIGENIVVTIWVYKYQDEVYYLYNNTNAIGYHFRPNEDIINNFYDNLDDFGKVLLNRESKPIYTAVFNTPFENDNGYFTYKRSYTWPCTAGWNPSLTGLGYETYINDLITLASFHDEFDSNNIWRSMTHEAIKNLDWTFTKVNGDEVIELDNIDSSKVEPILKIYGRQYDDLKRYIDNIKKSQNVTLDKRNNVPDYFLDDVLNLAGWETKSMILDEQNKTITKPLYPGRIKGYDVVDVNNEFLRRLKVFSPYLLSEKGTTKGMKALLGLLGLSEGYDYNIKEYVVVAKQMPQPSSDKSIYDEIVELNKMKYGYTTPEENPCKFKDLDGLPLARVIPANGARDYVIPWFDKTREYDGGLYFQMKGKWFEDTVSDIKMVSHVSELSQLGRYAVQTGDICYVTDISDFNEMFGTDIDTRMVSNYFYLYNDEFVNTYGATTDEDGNPTSGWTYLMLDGPKDEGGQIADVNMRERIEYMESVIDNNTGNNPHTGKGLYDYGESYIKNMLQPFKYTLDNDDFIEFAGSEGAVRNKAKNMCFSTLDSNGEPVITYTEDNKKTWNFFGVEGTPEGARSSFVGPETGGHFSEDAADMVINVKKLDVNFTCHIPSSIPSSQAQNFRKDFNSFIKDKVLFYLEQMVPSTAIFTYSIN